MSVVRYWTVFTIGVAAGAAVALAYAPQEGKKTRKQLKRHLDDTSDYLRDTADDFSKQAGKYASKAQDVAEDFSKTAGKYVAKAQDVAEDFGKTASKVTSRFV